MSKGWYGNLQKHSLASRGISTKDIKDIIQFTEVIDYSNSSEIIIGFWVSNIKNDYSKFNFDKAFLTLEKDLTNYIKTFDVTDKDLSKLMGKEIIPDSEMYDMVLEYGIDSLFFDAMSLRDKIINRNKGDLKKNIFLIDNAINLEHMSGSVLFDNTESDWLDIEKLRDNFDLAMKRMEVNYDKRLVW